MLLQEGDSCLCIARDVLLDKLDIFADEGSQVSWGFPVVLRKGRDDELTKTAMIHCSVLHLWGPGVRLLIAGFPSYNLSKVFYTSFWLLRYKKVLPSYSRTSGWLRVTLASPSSGRQPTHNVQQGLCLPTADGWRRVDSPIAPPGAHSGRPVAEAAPGSPGRVWRRSSGSAAWTPGNWGEHGRVAELQSSASAWNTKQKNIQL